VLSKPLGQDIPLGVRAVHAVSRTLGVFSAGLIVLAILVVCQMVFVRAVLGQSSIWQTEFSTFSILAATFLGAPYILLTRGHVGVDIVPMMLADTQRRVLYFVGAIVAIGFCGLFFYASLSWWYETWNSGQTTASMWRARLWIPYLSVPIGLGLLCLQYVAETWLVWTRKEEPYGMKPGVQI
jgi:TRAP-type C4-dicarboxylate transport system permease small subunit